MHSFQLYVWMDLPSRNNNNLNDLWAQNKESTALKKVVVNKLKILQVIKIQAKCKFLFKDNLILINQKS